MVHKWSITIPELTDEDRNVYVYLPESCRQYPDKRYPVLYMFDGHNVFFDSDATYGKCWGMKEYMGLYRHTDDHCSCGMQPYPRQRKTEGIYTFPFF